MKIADLLQSLSEEQVQYVLVGGLVVQLRTIKCIANRPNDQLDIVALEKIKRGEDSNV
jgi:hypothetical protein